MLSFCNKLKNSEFKVKSDDAEIQINQGNYLRPLETVDRIRDEIYKQARVKQSEEIIEVINNTSKISEKCMEANDDNSENDDNEISVGGHKLIRNFTILCV